MVGHAHREAHLIRFRLSIRITGWEGVTRYAVQVGEGAARAGLLREATVTADKVPEGAVLCVRDARMEERVVPGLQPARRHWQGAEEAALPAFHHRGVFRDVRSVRFGPGMGWQRIRTVERRGHTFSAGGLRPGGGAGEAAGLYRLLTC